MDWISTLAIAVVLGAFLFVKRSGQVSVGEAQALLKQGALLLDVRTAGEFVAGHLPHAVNMPLEEIESEIEQLAQSKDRVLLLHCQSGMRSGVAAKKLRAMGYARVYNMGSYVRAEKIVTGAF